MNRAALFSSARDDWETPRELCHNWRNVVPEGAILSEIKYLDTAIERFYHKRLGGRT
jgi:hypothetical protein